MPKTQKRRNPFTPGDGALPPYLAGREKEQAALLRMVQDLASKYVPPHNVLISAPRGNGKTVLLHWAANQAREREVNVVTASASELQSAAALMRATLGSAAAESAQIRTGRALGAKAGLTANLAHESTVATPPMGAYEWRLALTEACRQKPLLLVVDEGHLLPAEVANLLFNASQSVRGEGAPMLLIVAGTPDLEDALAKADVSFGDRLGADGDLRPGLLDCAAAGDAISVPLREQGIAIDKDALDAIVENAQGYPYFLQLWGQVAYDKLAEDSGRMTLARVQQAFPAVQETRLQYYGQRLREIQQADMMDVCARFARDMARNAQGGDLAQLQDWDAMCSIQAALQAKGTQADTPGCAAVQDALRRIKHWGFAVPSADLAHWTPGIPSLMAHVQQRAEDAGVLSPQSSSTG